MTTKAIKCAKRPQESWFAEKKETELTGRSNGTGPMISTVTAGLGYDINKKITNTTKKSIKKEIGEKRLEHDHEMHSDDEGIEGHGVIEGSMEVSRTSLVGKRKEKYKGASVNNDKAKKSRNMEMHERESPTLGEVDEAEKASKDEAAKGTCCNDDAHVLAHAW